MYSMVREIDDTCNWKDVGRIGFGLNLSKTYNKHKADAKIYLLFIHREIEVKSIAQWKLTRVEGSINQ